MTASASPGRLFCADCLTTVSWRRARSGAAGVRAAPTSSPPGPVTALPAVRHRRHVPQRADPVTGPDPVTKTPPPGSTTDTADNTMTTQLNTRYAPPVVRE